MASDPHTVLVIDRAEHARLLEPCGYETFDAASTLEALAALAERPDVSLLFSDVLLSRMSGAEFVRHVAALPTKIVVLHGATAGIDRMDAAMKEAPQRGWWSAFRRALRALWSRLTGGRRPRRAAVRPTRLAAG
jgi:CheY-like chemotaxis protein